MKVGKYYFIFEFIIKYLASKKNILFNKPFFSGNETNYIKELSESGDLSVNGKYSQKCKSFFKSKFNFNDCFLTTSCSSALEMCAILAGIKEGDEVIIPSFTYPSTANAFILRGATVVFCDSMEANPNIDIEKIEGLITERTKLIIPIHYGGVCCDMERLIEIAEKHGIKVVEDAAQAINVFVKLKDGSNKALGSFGDFATFSFHNTKNITCGAGGMLVVNNTEYLPSAYEVSENGTNKFLFDKGKVVSYESTGIGSSFLMSEINAAYLYAQLEFIDAVQERRKQIFELYLNNLSSKLNTSTFSTDVLSNYHIFYLKCSSFQEREELILFMKSKGVRIAFHYQSLHCSKYFKEKYQGVVLKNANNYSDVLVRLPVYFDLSNEEIQFISNCILEFYAN